MSIIFVDIVDVDKQTKPALCYMLMEQVYIRTGEVQSAITETNGSVSVHTKKAPAEILHWWWSLTEPL